MLYSAAGERPGYVKVRSRKKCLTSRAGKSRLFNVRGRVKLSQGTNGPEDELVKGEWQRGEIAIVQVGAALPWC